MEKTSLLVNLSETFNNFTFLGPVTSISPFFVVFPEYIDPSGHFIFYEFFCSSNF